jgi:hypothetical protein
MPSWKKVIISGSSAALTSVTATAGFTGSLSGSALTATSSSFASTASFVNTLNQSVIVTASMVIGSSSLGPNENTLTLGARDSVNEGGQLGLNAPGGTYTSASFLDIWQNQIRILRGSNAGSDGLVTQWNLHTKQMQLPAYTNASSFVGTAAANLAVDSGGNVITVSTTGGSVFPYVGNAVITGSLTVTQPIYALPNGGMYFQGGDDAALYDINVVNTMGIYGVQDVTVGAIKLGSNGPVLYGSGSRLGLGTITPSSASFTVNGNVWATSFTGSLLGTASYATQALSSSFATSASFAVSSSRAVTASFAISASWAPSSPPFPFTGSAQITGSLGVTGSLNIAGNLITSGSDGKGINTSTTELNAGSGTGITVNWGSGQLFDNNSINTVDWLNAYTLTAPSFGGVTTVNWGTGLLNSLTTSASIDWDNRYAYDSAGTASIDWENRAARDVSDLRSIFWDVRLLYDTSEITSVDWENRELQDSSGVASAIWGARTLTDTSGTTSVNWEGRLLISATSAVKVLDWTNDTFLSSTVYQRDIKSIGLQDEVSTGPPLTDSTYLGDIIEGKVNGSNPPSDGQLCYLATDGNWYSYDQTDSNFYGKMIGIVFKVDSGPETCYVLLEGHVLIDSSSPVVQSPAYGMPVYIRDGTATGEMSTAIPTTGIIQVLGHCYYQNSTTSTNWMMKFRPSMDWYQI